MLKKEDARFCITFIGYVCIAVYIAVYITVYIAVYNSIYKNTNIDFV